MNENSEGIESLKVFDQTVARPVGWIFCDEGTKKAIPYDKRTGIIGIQILWVFAVMYAVVRWCVEHGFDPPGQFFDSVGVQKELVHRVQSTTKNDH